MCYDIELFDEKIHNSNLICPIGRGIIDKVVGLPCKDGLHIFCEMCITKWLKDNKTCPICRSKQSSNNLVKVQILDDMINKIECKCDKKECEWNGKISELSNHKKECDYVMLKCPFKNCGKKMIRKEMIEHKKECIYKSINCKMCDKKIVYDKIENHYKNCPKMLVKCIFCNNETFKKDLTNHIKDECMETYIDCKYKLYGCNHRLLRKDNDKHNEDNLKYHLELTTNELNKYNTINELKINDKYNFDNMIKFKYTDEIRDLLLCFKIVKYNNRPLLHTSLDNYNTTNESIDNNIKITVCCNYDNNDNESHDVNYYMQCYENYTVIKLNNKKEIKYITITNIKFNFSDDSDSIISSSDDDY